MDDNVGNLKAIEDALKHRDISFPMAVNQGDVTTQTGMSIKQAHELSCFFERNKCAVFLKQYDTLRKEYLVDCRVKVRNELDSLPLGVSFDTPKYVFCHLEESYQPIGTLYGSNDGLV